jgi:hypothetical protein
MVIDADVPVCCGVVSALGEAGDADFGGSALS